MRKLLKGCLVCLAAVVLVSAVGLAWLFFDSRGLPNTQSLAQFAPSKTARVTDPCHSASSNAIPYELIGINLRSALYVAESPEDGPGVLSATLRGLVAQPGPASLPLSEQIARTTICEPIKPLNRYISEIRIAVQLERHFSRRELFAMLANRLYLGGKTVGVESASQYYFHKEPDQLLIGESALLAGLAKRPAYYSPIRHPDHALIRRNEVIDAMAQRRLISESEAVAAKATPLVIARE